MAITFAAGHLTPVRAAMIKRYRNQEFKQLLGALAIMALMGVSNGFSSTLSGAMWPELYGTQHLGAIRSVVVATMAVASAAGPGLTGYLIDAGVDYSLQLAAMGLYSVATALGMWTVSQSIRRTRAEALPATEWPR